MFLFFRMIPFLEPDYVAEKVVEAVLTNQKLLMMPRSMYFLYALKGFEFINYCFFCKTKINNFITFSVIAWEAENYLSSNTFKTNNSMDEFVGRKKNF
jgi:hypothetical protein